MGVMGVTIDDGWGQLIGHDGESKDVEARCREKVGPVLVFSGLFEIFAVEECD